MKSEESWPPLAWIAFGIATIVMGFNGRSTVRDSLKQEQIVGTPDPMLAREEFYWEASQQRMTQKPA